MISKKSKNLTDDQA